MTFFSLNKYCLKKYLYIIIVWDVWYVEINAMSKFTPITHQPSGQVSDSGCELQCEIATCIQVQYWPRADIMTQIWTCHPLIIYLPLWCKSLISVIFVFVLILRLHVHCTMWTCQYHIVLKTYNYIATYMYRIILIICHWFLWIHQINLSAFNIFSS